MVLTAVDITACWDEDTGQGVCGVDTHLHTFLTWALNGGKRLASC